MTPSELMREAGLTRSHYLSLVRARVLADDMPGSGNHRAYTHADLRRARVASSLLALGVGTAGIRRHVGALMRGETVRAGVAVVRVDDAVGTEATM